MHAFWQLAEELEAHGLPGAHARAAAADEVRHARETTKLALSFGHLPAAPRVVPLSEPRSLEEIAIDNGFEGCGRELFGAKVNAWQAERATDQRVRALMREITPDEHDHAAFSFALAQTLMPRLTVPARRRVREAEERALSTLAPHAVPEPVRRQLGLMDAEQAERPSQRLLDFARVWIHVAAIFAPLLRRASEPAHTNPREHISSSALSEAFVLVGAAGFEPATRGLDPLLRTAARREACFVTAPKISSAAYSS